MHSPEILTDVVKSFTGKSPRGASAHFIKIDDTWGIKVFRKPMERTPAYEMQKKMAGLGFAPRVGIMFDLPCGTPCYVTEIAQVLIDESVDEFNLTGEAWQERHELRQQVRIANEARITELTEKMSDHGFHMEDGHIGNFGWLNGNFVCIDFGEAGW